MKDILSYWDISLGLLAIGFGIFRWYKINIDRKKNDDRMLQEGKWVLAKNGSFEYTLCMAFIVFGALFIYNRLKGNMPNIIILLKYFATH